MKRRVAFAYVVQLDLPGYPVKIGQTSQVHKRLATFEHGTPVDCRVIGITTNGREREAEMLDATRDAVIRSEWRYPTAQLRALLKGYYLAGEWFVAAPDHSQHFIDSDVEARVRRVAEPHSIFPKAIGYYWAQGILQAAYADDPMLGIDWNGFVAATRPPSLDWPNTKRAAA